MFIIYLWQSCYCFLCSCFCTHVIVLLFLISSSWTGVRRWLWHIFRQSNTKGPYSPLPRLVRPRTDTAMWEFCHKRITFLVFFFLLYVLPFGNCAQMLCGATQPVTCIYPNLSCWLTCLTQAEGEGELRSERWLLAKVISAFRVVNWRNIQGLVFSVILVEGCYEHTCKCSFPSEFVKKEFFCFFFFSVWFLFCLSSELLPMRDFLNRLNKGLLTTCWEPEFHWTCATLEAFCKMFKNQIQWTQHKIFPLPLSVCKGDVSVQCPHTKHPLASSSHGLKKSTCSTEGETTAGGELKSCDSLYKDDLWPLRKWNRISSIWSPVIT